MVRRLAILVALFARCCPRRRSAADVTVDGGVLHVHRRARQDQQRHASPRRAAGTVTIDARQPATTTTSSPHRLHAGYRDRRHVRRRHQRVDRRRRHERPHHGRLSSTQRRLPGLTTIPVDDQRRRRQRRARRRRSQRHDRRRRRRRRHRRLRRQRHRCAAATATTRCGPNTGTDTMTGGDGDRHRRPTAGASRRPSRSTALANDGAARRERPDRRRRRGHRGRGRRRRADASRSSATAARTGSTVIVRPGDITGGEGADFLEGGPQDDTLDVARRLARHRRSATAASTP